MGVELKTKHGVAKFDTPKEFAEFMGIREVKINIQPVEHKYKAEKQKKRNGNGQQGVKRGPYRKAQHLKKWTKTEDKILKKLYKKAKKGLTGKLCHGETQKMANKLKRSRVAVTWRIHRMVKSSNKKFY